MLELAIALGMLAFIGMVFYGLIESLRTPTETSLWREGWRWRQDEATGEMRLMPPETEN